MLFARIVTLFLVALVVMSSIFYEFYSMRADSDRVKLSRVDPTISVIDSRHFFLLNGTLSSLKTELQKVHDKQKIATAENNPRHVSLHPDFVSNGLDTTVPMKAVVLSSSKVPARKTALLYTMDSIKSYESASEQGGAAGEILIRSSLAKIFQELNVVLDVKESDQEFESSNTSNYDFIIVDPWTWAAKGWVPKPHLVGMEHKTYVLDFFGSRVLRGTGFKIPPSRFLTAYNTNSYNTFLGYYMDDLADTVGNTSSPKRLQGIIWGKDTKHFEGKNSILRSMASKVHLLSTATSKVFEHDNIHWLGHQSKEKWYALLRESRFLLGLGEPLLGPSALDAVAAGCMYLNPIYSTPLHHNDQTFSSQHPYALEKIGEPYVCSYHENDVVSLQSCIDKSLRMDLEPHIPSEFTKEAYRQRVIQIFNL